MSTLGRFNAYLSLSIVCLCACKAGTQASTPMTTLKGQQGGMIVYGTVSGATTQAAALTNMLHTIHNNCAEKPQIGRVFQFKGTNSVGVFFSVTDHPDGNIPLGGLVIANATGPNQVEAAMIYDQASRFGNTVNPMLQQLFSVWQPGASSPAAGTAPATAGNAGGSLLASQGGSNTSLHPVTAPDNSASIGIPDGWKLDPQSAGGTMSVIGPNGEQVVYAANKPAVDPNNPHQVAAVRYGIYKGSGTMLFPYHPDLGKAYPELIQAWRLANNMQPAKLQVDKIEPMNPPKGGGSCVLVTGHIDADGQGMKKLIDDICEFPPAQWGAYTITRNFNIMTDALSDQEQSTVMAIYRSAKVNQQVINQQMQQKLGQKQQSDQQWRAWGQQQSNQIRAQGEAAQANFANRQAANDAQHADWNAGQDANAQNNAGFSNYLLDQSVVQNNATGAHSTQWNSTADALVKSNPNRFQYVDNQNLIKGTDY